MMIPKIFKKVSDLLDIPLYLVGGAVRDILMKKTPKDWDFTTPKSPDEVEEAIKKAGKKPYLMGKKFGTVGFKIEIEPKVFEYVEITTFRNEEYAKNSRKPQVSYVDKIEEDLNRRDFTINAMAMKENGEIIDLHGGQQDLQNNLVRVVGNKKSRFKEDPLRILRAIRFATILDFSIEEETLEYIKKMKFELLNISKERWVMELDKILVSENVEKGLDLLMESGIMKIILPEISVQHNYEQDSPYHRFDLWTHTKKVVSSVPKEQLDLRWTALLHDIAKPITRTKNKRGYSNYIYHEALGADMAKKVCTHLKFSNKRTDFIIETIRTHLNEDSVLREYDNCGK